jgi:hypothetical protein
MAHEKVKQEAVGNLKDFIHLPYTFGKNSTMAHLNTFFYHIHGESFTFPKYADPLTITSNAAAWNLTGTPVVIIGASATDRPFDLHWVIISSISDTLEGMLTFYADGVEIETAPVSRTSNFSREEAMPLQILPQPAGTVITAMFTDNTTGAKSCKIRVKGHYYG